MALSLIDSLEFDATDCNYPRIVNVSGEVYAIAYGQGDKVRVATVNITAAGVVTNIASREIATGPADGNTQVRFPIVNLTGDIYVIAYTDNNFDGWVCTVDIDSAGTISAVIDTLEFEPTFAVELDMIAVGTAMVAIVGGMSPPLVTVGIDGSGNIDAAITDSSSVSNISGDPRIINISGTIYAIVAYGSGSDGYVSTISILTDGTIGVALVDQLEFETTFCRTPYLANVDGDIYAIVYRDTDIDGQLVTVEIDGSGNIGAAVIDTLEFETSTCYFPNILNFSGTTFAIFYQGVASDGWASTVTIDASGNITAVAIGSSGLEWDTDKGASPTAIKIADKVIAVAYTGTDDDGFVKTIGETPFIPKVMIF